jgi:hypothetical protein
MGMHRLMLLCLISGLSFGQQQETAETSNKRLFGLIPNARSSPRLTKYEPLTVKQKFKIAKEDCFDRGTVVLAALFAGVGDLQASNRSFGTGVAGYSKYFGTSYGDFVIGNAMTEGVFPSMLHQDPRYFRLGEGSKWSRVGHSVKQIFWTRTDSGGSQFNFSEIGGNSAAVAISTSYYPENRNGHDAVVKLGTQIGIDMASNILKEFGPDLTRWMRSKREKK